MTSEQVHKIGAQRHKFGWLTANRRAIEAASAAGLNYSGEMEKIGIPAIVLKVLDGRMIETGFVWSKEMEKWIPRTEHEQSQKVANRLMAAG